MNEKYLMLLAGMGILIWDIFQYIKYIEQKKNRANLATIELGHQDKERARRATKIQFLIATYSSFVLAIYFIIKSLTM